MDMILVSMDEYDEDLQHKMFKGMNIFCAVRNLLSVSNVYQVVVLWSLSLQLITN